jgi:hypothetical protein
MATLTGCARVRNNQHWASDAFFGVAIGVSSGLHTLSREEKRPPAAGRDGAGVRLTPSLSGLTLSYSF